jgi:endo-1,4-beta-D-glucanase Y
MSGIARPFGSHTFAYATGSILPSGSRPGLDAVTSAFYQKWKAIYVDTKGCSEGAHIVFHHFIRGREATVSEAMGYGMVVLPMMAGCDADARAIYDSMHAFVSKHIDSHGLLAWKQVASGGSCPSDADDSATDGDLDVAFSYLLADKQWGSSGPINYLAEAKKWLAAIKAHDIVAGTHVTNLGDVASENTTRPSDWMFDHFRAFAKIDPFFSQTITDTYAIADHVQSKYAPKTGLIPDYIINVGSADPAPTAPGTEVQESTFTDSEVAYNSCRVPWHLGTDFLVSGDARAKKAADAINRWIQMATGGDPNRIIDGYKLDGSPGSLNPADYAPDPPMHGQSLAFSAPFAVAAMTDAANQPWLDALFKWVAVDRPDIVTDDDYYGNTLKMIDLIILSGNWWDPSQ